VKNSRSAMIVLSVHDVSPFAGLAATQRCFAGTP
jgi:hypothetical protein